MNIISSLHEVGESENGSLGKIAVENFLNMENNYCESLGLASEQKEMAYAIGGTGFRAENSSDRASERYLRQAQLIENKLKLAEANFEKYGFVKTWGAVVNEPKDASGAKLERPSYVDDTQWQYLNKFELKSLESNAEEYIWISVLDDKKLIPEVLVATKNFKSQTMVVVTEHFFCNEKKVMIDDGVHVGQGYASHVDYYSMSSPVKIKLNSSEDAAYKVVCAKKWWNIF